MTVPRTPEVPGTDAAGRRRPSSRAWRLVAAGLAGLFGVGGAAMYAYEPATDAYQGRLQARLTAQLRTPEIRAAYASHKVAEGDSLTRIRIPAINVDVVVVEGTSASALRAGAGHYPATPLPGQPGNVAIAGHRTTFGRPFTDLDRLNPGDDIFLETPLGQYRYQVARAPFVVNRADWSPIAATSESTLTLSTCHPKKSDRQRLIVRAALVPGAQG